MPALDSWRRTTAALLAHIAEVDARKLYLPAAHPSMFSYCVEELGLSEDAAYSASRRRARRADFRLSSRLWPKVAYTLVAWSCWPRT